MILLLIPFFGLKAQIYVVGQDAASLKWREISNERFRLIYPDGYKRSAMLYLKSLTVSQKATLRPYVKDNPPRFDIVLHEESTFSNAIVTPAPLHSDFFDIPDQSLYAERWQYQLALHEYRHFSQIRKMYDGIGKGLYYVFGQAGPSVLLGAFVPFWFIEGDAVYNETIHSKSGRGRYPAFWMDLKAQVLDKGIYKYDKAYLGSYKDYVPDHYTLGYQLFLYGLENYGERIWDVTLTKVARRAYTFKPFVNGLKQETGLNKVQYYKWVLGALKTGWKAEQEKENPTKLQKAGTAVSKQYFTSYRFPHRLSDGSIVAERSSLDDIHRFVRIYPNGTEKVLFTPGFDFNESLSVNDSLICWNEKQYDLRWSNVDFSIVRIYNFKTGKLRQISRKSRYFAPSLSPDATKVVVSVVSDHGDNQVMVLDAVSGKELYCFQTDDNQYLMTPRWSDDGKKITVVALGDQGKKILILDPATGDHEMALDAGFTEVNRPFMKGNKILFTGTWKGVNDIYELDLVTKKVYRIVAAKYGAEDVTLADDGTLLFSDYSADGYRSAMVSYGSLKKELINTGDVFEYPVDRMVNKNTFVLEDTVMNTPDYKEKKYGKLKHLFNVHSWGPLLFDVNNYEFMPNAVVMSQNLLGTAVSTLGYYYDVNEKRGKVKFTFDYTGLFPVMGLSVQYRGRHKNFIDSNGNYHSVNWNETDIAFNMSVPLRFIKSKWIRGLRPSFSLDQKFLKMSKDSDVSFKENDYTILKYGAYGYNFLKRSRLDIFSPWSQSLSVYYEHTPFSAVPSHIALVAGTFTFPGLFKHHGFKVYLGNQWKEDGNYPFSDLIRTPRGYDDLTFTDMFSLRTDYAFPIAYPDWNVPTVFYITRIYGDLFYDYSRALEPAGYNDLSSAGFELYTNWYFLSLPVEFTLGFRGSFLFDGGFTPEFLISIGY